MPVSVTVRVIKTGWHSWPTATKPRRYLADLHRHRFHVEVEVPIDHYDREVEFHDLMDLVHAWWGPENNQEDRGACEAMAAGLARFIDVKLSRTPTRVAVGEDGEAWATWRPEVPP